MDKENKELLFGSLGLGILVGTTVVLMDRNTCIKGGGVWKLPLGPCSCPSGTTWDHTQNKCVGQSPATTLPEPTGFKLVVPETATSSTVQCTAEWDPVAEMVSGDYYALTISANGTQIVNQEVPMGATSYSFSAPAGAALSGKCAACSPS